jgi:hypothetical protein
MNVTSEPQLRDLKEKKRKEKKEKGKKDGNRILM